MPYSILLRSSSSRPGSRNFVAWLDYAAMLDVPALPIEHSPLDRGCRSPRDAFAIGKTKSSLMACSLASLISSVIKSGHAASRSSALIWLVLPKSLINRILVRSRNEKVYTVRALHANVRRRTCLACTVSPTRYATSFSIFDPRNRMMQRSTGGSFSCKPLWRCSGRLGEAFATNLN